jgi:hypothetical protein
MCVLVLAPCPPPRDADLLTELYHPPQCTKIGGTALQPMGHARELVAAYRLPHLFYREWNIFQKVTDEGGQEVRSLVTRQFSQSVEDEPVGGRLFVSRTHTRMLHRSVIVQP